MAAAIVWKREVAVSLCCCALLESTYDDSHTASSRALHLFGVFFNNIFYWLSNILNTYKHNNIDKNIESSQYGSGIYKHKHTEDNTGVLSVR